MYANYKAVIISDGLVMHPCLAYCLDGHQYGCTAQTRPCVCVCVCNGRKRSHHNMAHLFSRIPFATIWFRINLSCVTISVANQIYIQMCALVISKLLFIANLSLSLLSRLCSDTGPMARTHRLVCRHIFGLIVAVGDMDLSKLKFNLNANNI